MKTLFLILLSLVQTEPYRSPGFIGQNAKVSFDEANYLVFEDVGRIEDFTSGVLDHIRFGAFIRLHVCRDGNKYDIDLVDPAYSKDDVRYPLISPQARQIRYKNKEEIWIISRGGHRGDQAILYDLAKKRTLYDVGGARFSLSPDADKIAYCCAANSDLQIVVFVNDMMVYPVKGIFKWSPGNAPRTEKGVLWSDYVKDAPDSWIEGAIVWKDSNTIQFTMLEYPPRVPRSLDNKEAHYPGEPPLATAQYVVSDLRTSGTAIVSENVRIARTVLPSQ